MNDGRRHTRRDIADAISRRRRNSAECEAEPDVSTGAVCDAGRWRSVAAGGAIVGSSGCSSRMGFATRANEGAARDVIEGALSCSLLAPSGGLTPSDGAPDGAADNVGRSSNVSWARNSAAAAMTEAAGADATTT